MADIKLKCPDIEFLIPHLKHEDPHLYEALLRLKRCVVPEGFLKEVAKGIAVGPFFTARGILPGLQAVANDILANRFHVKLTLDSKKVQIGSKILLQDTTLTAKIKPTAGNYKADVLVSRDQGVTFKSIYEASKLVLPQNLETIRIAGNFAVPELFDNDQLRVDVLQVDGVVSGMEILIRGVVV